MGSLKVALTIVADATPVAPDAGDQLAIVGGVMSACANGVALKTRAAMSMPAAMNGRRSVRGRR